MEITFHGGDDIADVFVVDSVIEAGHKLCSHRHAHPHLSCLVSGTADVTIEGKTERKTGRCYINVPAGQFHEVVAVTDIVWLCMSAGDVTQIENAHESLKLIKEG